jgi:hypothetical protein
MSLSKAELFPDKFFNLANLDKLIPPGRILVITALTVEAIGETRTPKPLLAFAGLDERLVLSKGRYETLERLFGQDTDDWPGNAITLATGTVRGAATITIAAARPAQKVAAAS